MMLEFSFQWSRLAFLVEYMSMFFHLAITSVLGSILIVVCTRDRVLNPSNLLLEPFGKLISIPSTTNTSNLYKNRLITFFFLSTDMKLVLVISHCVIVDILDFRYL